jgi:hypothetical protein
MHTHPDAPGPGMSTEPVPDLLVALDGYVRRWHGLPADLRADLLAEQVQLRLAR